MLKKLSLLFFIFVNLSFAMTKDNIESQMSNKINQAMIILQDSTLSKEQKADKIISHMSSIFDYDLMSKLSLGKKWKELSKEKKAEFTKLFTKKLKNSYTDKLDLYDDEKFEILGKEESKKNRITLKTQLISKNEKYDINYKFYKVKNIDNWLIYDVDIVGISLIQTYRNQFAGFLKDNSFDELLINLKNSK